MLKLFNYIGLFLERDSSLPYNYKHLDYRTTDKNKVIAHKELLSAIEKKEDMRLEVIEAKTSQIITYTGIIFSGLSLFIPILLSKSSEQGLNIRILLISFLVLALFFYFLTINNAIRNYNVAKFIYSGSDPNNAIKYQNKSVEEFTSIEIQDLLYSINRNLKTNNEKASNLIYAFRTFRIANLITAILGILICFSVLFIKPKVKESRQEKETVANTSMNDCSIK